MKKAIIVLMVLCLLTASFADTVLAQAAVATAPPLSMQILGKKAASPPVLKDGKVYLPLRSVGETLGYKVTWDAKTSTMELKASGSTLKVTIGSKTAYVNGQKTTLDAAPIMYKDRAHVYLTFAQKYFNYTTTYDKAKNVVTIEKKTAAAGSGNTAAQTKGIYILGKKVNTTDLPLVKDNVTYIPLRHFGEGLGYKVTWTASTKTMDLKSDKGSARVVIGSGNASVNGKTVKISPAAVLYNGRAYVPVSFIENNFEYQVSYNKEKNIANIDRKTAAASSGTSAETKGFYVLGKKMSTVDLPLIKDNITYIPLRHFGEGVGYTVTWTASTETMDMKSDKASAKVVIGSGTAVVNGKNVKISPEAVLYNGRAYVPVSFIEGNFEYDVKYDKAKNIASIDKRKPTEVLPEKQEDTTVYGNAKLQDVIYDDSGGFPQLNIVSDNPVKYKSVTMYDPDRMVIDIENSTLGTEFETKEINKGGIIGVRVSQYSTNPNIVRVVVDLEDEQTCMLVQSNDKKTVSLIYANIINPVGFMKENGKDVLLIRGTQDNDTNVFQLANPDRLVVDVQKAVLKEQQSVEAKTDYVKTIRTGQVDVGVARVVLDLEPDMYYDVKNEGSLTKVYVSNVPFSFVDYKKYYNSASIKLSVGTEVEYQPIIDEASRTLRVLIPGDLDVEQKIYPINDNMLQQIEVTKEVHGDAIYTAAAFKMKPMVDFELLSPAVTKLVNIRFMQKAESIDQLTVLIDPGHGGTDPGAISIDKSMNEKTLNLDVALRLNRILKGLGFNTMMTRSDDRYVDLASRSGMANDNYVDFFMSIHFNAFTSSAKGIETLYYPNEITDEYPMDNREMANIFHNEIIGALKRPSRGITPRPGLHVLNKTKMPAILAELGFITNKEEFAEIKKEEYREMAARALAVAIVKYFEEMEGMNLGVDTEAIYAAPVPSDAYAVQSAEPDSGEGSLVSEQISNDIEPAN